MVKSCACLWTKASPLLYLFMSSTWHRRSRNHFNFLSYEALSGRDSNLSPTRRRADEIHVEPRSWYKNTFLFICLIEELFYQKHKNNFEYSPFSCCRAVFLLARCKMFRNCKYYCPVITKQMQTYHFLYKLWKILFV